MPPIVCGGTQIVDRFRLFHRFLRNIIDQFFTHYPTCENRLRIFCAEYRGADGA